jgi:chromosome segregation ATPase
MQSKSTRGVQQEEVWAAADALIAAGERPTIERVRLKIGRGSPNTVSPMLESWFATLARRLGVAASGGAQPAENGAPEALRQALDVIWSNAVTAARDKAEAALASERDKLAQLDKELDSQRQLLLERESVLAQRGATFEHALEMLRAQMRDQTVQLEQAGRELEWARSSLATLVQERDADRRQFDEQLRTLADERQRIEQRTADNERRLLEEVDRSRQDAKQALRALEDAGQKHAAEKQPLERANAALGARVHEGELEVVTLKEKLRAAEARAVELQRLLHEQTETINAVIAQTGRTINTKAQRKTLTARRKSGAPKP